MLFRSSIHCSAVLCAVLALAVSASAQTTHYVSLDGECDGNTPCYATIQAAINAAAHGDEVVIAPGSYGGCNNFNGKAITVRSTDPDDPDIVAATVLTGCGAIVAGAVEFDSNEGPDAILRGLTIAATGETSGVFINDASPTIDRCVFTGHNGGTNRGMQIESSSAATITQCTFIDNHPHGSTFSGCPGAGGGGAILVCGGSGNGLLISDCTFTNNSIAVGGSTGGAISTGSGLVTITGCTFTGNSAPAGNGDGNGAVRAGGSSTVSNCTFINNSAPLGGAMASAGTVVDCHFTGNQANLAGGALHIHGAGTAENCTSGDCVVTTSSSCLAARGAFQGAGANCAEVECIQPCIGDLNGDGVVDVFDLLALLAVWGACP